MGGLAVVVAAVHLITGWHAEGPVVFDDEGGYLRIARHLAGEGPPAGVKYFPGYSLFIVPLHWAFDSTGMIFNSVKVLNALLGAAFVALAYLTSGYLVEQHRRGARVAATAVAATYPSYLLFSNHAFAENALVPLSMLLTYLVARFAREPPRAALAAGIGAVAAFTVVVHPRAVGVVVAAGVVLTVWWWPPREHWRRLAAFGTGGVLVGALGLAIVAWERSTAALGSGSYPLEAIVESRLRWGGLLDLVAGAAGQLLYLLLATGGLVVIAGLEVADAVRKRAREGDQSSLTALLIFVGLAAAIVFLMSTFFISPRPPDWSREDAVIYGRYNEGLLAPLLLAGAAAVVGGRVRFFRRERWRMSAFPWLVGLAVGAAAAVELWQFDDLLRDHFVNPFNVLALYSVIVPMGGVNPPVLAVLAVGGGGAFLLLAERRRWWAVALAVTAFVVVATRMATFYLPRDHYDVREQERIVARTINEIDERFSVECVAADAVMPPHYHLRLYHWYVDGARFEVFNSKRDEGPCGPLVVTSRLDLDASYPGARLVRREGREIGAYLWVLPGEMQESLEREGFVS